MTADEFDRDETLNEEELELPVDLDDEELAFDDEELDEDEVESFDDEEGEAF